MKVLLINGSPHDKGCTFTALSTVAEELQAQGIETEMIQTGKAPVRDCVACGGCRIKKGRCVFNDDVVNEIIEKAEDADGFVFGSPVYYGHPSGRILSILDRVFFAGSYAFTRKPGAVVVSARRGGTTASLEVLEKPLGLAQMPIVSSTYWNMVHGNSPAEVAQDLEGLQTMRNLGRNMAWLLKSIEAGKKAGLPAPETLRGDSTNFIR